MAMKTLKIEDLSKCDELDRAAMAATQGGMMKLPQQRVNPSQLLTTPDGDPVQVYVDGVLINSVSTGYAPK
jgi:hypothetical protein